MVVFQFLIKIFYKHKWFILFSILFAAILVFYFTGKMPRSYKVVSTIYTGIASGFSIVTDDNKTLDFNSVNNQMDNLINIIESENTLRMVSLHLFVTTLKNGSATSDNQYVEAKTYQEIVKTVPQNIRTVIDNSSQSEAVDSLLSLSLDNNDNYIYRLLNLDTPFFSYQALSGITIRRLGSSDMLNISYMCEDPGIAYNTIKILNEEYVKQYQLLQFGETDSVIIYFQNQLAKCHEQLTLAEDTLIDYNVKNKVINYEEQTKQMAVQSRDYNLDHIAALTQYNVANELLVQLDDRMKENMDLFHDNSLYIEKIHELSDMAYKNVFESIVTKGYNPDNKLNDSIAQKQRELNDFLTEMSPKHYSKNGLSSQDIIKEWFAQTLNKTISKATYDGIMKRKADLDSDYNHYSPVGAILKRKERQIDFLENQYLNLQNGLNSALTKRKSLEMSSGTLKVINPPQYPLVAQPSKRSMMLMATVLGVFLFIMSYYIIMSIVDQTINDIYKAEKILNLRILGGFAAPFTGKYAKFQQEGYDVSADYLRKSVLPFLKSEYPNVIIVTGIEKGCGKTYLSEVLSCEFNKMNICCEYFSFNKDFDVFSQSYLWAKTWRDICSYHGSEVVIIELPSLNEAMPNKAIMEESIMDLFIIKATSVWLKKDQLLFNQFRDETNKSKLFIYMNYLSRDSMMDIVGLMPPLTKMRSLFYRLFNLQFKKK